MSEQALSTGLKDRHEPEMESLQIAEEGLTVNPGLAQSGRSLEENLERLAAVNLSSDRSLEPRLSTAMIRLVSALAGVGFLLLFYLIFKLFV